MTASVQTNEQVAGGFVDHQSLWVVCECRKDNGGRCETSVHQVDNLNEARRVARGSETKVQFGGVERKMIADQFAVGCIQFNAELLVVASCSERPAKNGAGVGINDHDEVAAAVSEVRNEVDPWPNLEKTPFSVCVRRASAKNLGTPAGLE